MKEYPFHQVDVFTDTALRGNPLAVVHGADGLSDEQMRAFAAWTNLSETTFLLAPRDPAADYRIRILTPKGELMFAGHPTLGSCRAWLARGGVPKRKDRIVQECGVGLVELRQDGGRLAFQAPPCRRSDVDPDELDLITRALGLAPAAVEKAARLDNGTVWVTLLLRDAKTVLGLDPDHSALRSLPKVGVVGPNPAGSATHLEIRGFAASQGIPEDPVTGSLNAGVAQWLIGEGRAPDTYVASQGTRLGRAGRVHVRREGEIVWIGGDVTPCIEGTVRL